MEDYELRVHVLKNPRTNEKLYFKSGKEAHRVEEACMMVYVGRELFHTGYPMPHIEDWRPNVEVRGRPPLGDPASPPG